MEVTVTAPTRFEITAQGKPAGSVGLRGGEKLEVVSASDGYVVVRYHNLNGRVAAKDTDLPTTEAPCAPVAEPLPATAIPVPAKTPAPAPPPYQPATAIEHVLSHKLVAVDGGAIRPRDDARLAGVKFYGLYYSASWCAPCRAFTPELIDAYNKIHAIYPEFEIVLVNCDHSAGDMAAYMRDDHMPWPALAWTALHETPAITHYAGSGIPCLVLIDAEGKVLSDSFRWGTYVGPDAVLDDTWKILRDYRRTNPRRKA